VTVTNAPRLSGPARREQILGVALEVMGTAGFDGASMNDVAEAAGVTKPVLYQHFASKRDLYLALLDAVGGQLLHAIAEATAGAPDGKSQTERGFMAYFRWVASDQDAFLLLFGGGSGRDDEFRAAVRRVCDEAAELIAPLIAADIDPEQRRIIAHGLVGLAEGASRHLVDEGRPFDPDETAATVARVAWAGLRALG